MNKELLQVLNEATDIPMITHPATMEKAKMSKTEAENEAYKARATVNELKAKYPNDFIIADHYQLGRLEGRHFSLEVKKLITKGQMVAVAHALQYNSDWTNTGQIYVVDEAATDSRNKASEEHRIKSEKRRQDEENKRTNVTVGTSKNICGVSKDGKLYENIDEAEKEEYAFTGSKLKCDQYITDNFAPETYEKKPAKKVENKKSAKKSDLPHGVDKNFDVFAEISPDEEKDYIFLGSEEDCDSYAAVAQEKGKEEADKQFAKK